MYHRVLHCYLMLMSHVEALKAGSVILTGIFYKIFNTRVFQSDILCHSFYLYSKRDCCIYSLNHFKIFDLTFILRNSIVKSELANCRYQISDFENFWAKALRWTPNHPSYLAYKVNIYAFN